MTKVAIFVVWGGVGKKWKIWDSVFISQNNCVDACLDPDLCFVKYPVKCLIT